MPECLISVFVFLVPHFPLLILPPRDNGEFLPLIPILLRRPMDRKGQLCLITTNAFMARSSLHHVRADERGPGEEMDRNRAARRKYGHWACWVR